MKIRSRLFSLVVVLVLLVVSFSFSSINAASGTLSVSANKSDVNKGDKNVTVTITLSADAVIYSGEFNFVYDSSIFSYEGYAGKINIKYDPTSPEASKNYTWTYTFTALTTGTGKFSIEGCRMITDSGTEMVEMPITTGSTSVKVWAPGSDDASLKSLEIPGRTLSPAFTPGTSSYTVNLPHDVTSVSINAVQSQPESTGAKHEISSIPNPLPVGETKVTIKGYAPNGSTMTYTIKIIRAAAPGEPTPTPEKPKDIEVNVDGSTYIIAKDFAGITLPDGFESNSYTYNGENITIGKDLKRKLILVYLKGGDGIGSFYIYDEAKKNFTKYIEIKTTGVSYTVLSVGSDVKIPDGYDLKTTADIFGIKVSVYRQPGNSDGSILFYGMNSNGEANWYRYDSKEATIQRYSLASGGSASQGDSTLKSAQDEINKLNKNAEDANNKYKQDSSFKLKIIAGLSVICVLLIALVIYLFIKIRRNSHTGTPDFILEDIEVKNLDEL